VIVCITGFVDDDTDAGLFEVGVHIADVSFFVEPDTALDQIAVSRTTSVYLVQKVCYAEF